MGTDDTHYWVQFMLQTQFSLTGLHITYALVDTVYDVHPILHITIHKCFLVQVLYHMKGNDKKCREFLFPALRYQSMLYTAALCLFNRHSFDSIVETSNKVLPNTQPPYMFPHCILV